MTDKFDLVRFPIYSEVVLAEIVLAERKAAVLDEREACAVICAELPAPIGTRDISTYEVATLDCATAIRQKK